MTTERDDIIERHALLVQENSLLKSRTNIAEDKMQGRNQEMTHLAQDLDEWKKDAFLWKKERDEGRKEIARLRKYIDGIVSKDVGRLSPQPSPPEQSSLPRSLNRRNATRMVHRRLLNSSMDLSAG